jgi:recombination protein RecA
MATKKDKSKKDDPKDLKSVLAGLEKEYGEGVVIQGNVVVKGVEGISTGGLTLDAALGVGGVPRGRVSEIFGPESSGKTTICLEVISSAQRTGGKAVFIDVEHALDPVYAQNLGVNMDELILSQPNSAEQALTICERLAGTGEIDVIVVDSVAALTPQCELDGEIGAANIGAQARLMSQCLRRLTAIISKSKTAVLFTNQLREKIGVMFGNPETTPGGRALKFYASVRMDIRRIEAVKNRGDEDATGNRVRVKVVKNKVATPFKKAEFEITFGKGVNKMGALIEMAESLDIVVQKGSNFKYGDNSFNGRAKLLDFLLESPDVIKKIDQQIREHLQLNPPEKVEEDLPAPEDELVIKEE